MPKIPRLGSRHSATNKVQHVQTMGRRKTRFPTILLFYIAKETEKTSSLFCAFIYSVHRVVNYRQLI